ncbi:capsid protein of prophage [Escherichia coli]|uniref:Capsid protein of prophage n=1 Tax=Escherichia coli TaxID=562 RepID=A0AB38GS66_ECOLX|nr:capsid protein of prophage [Escherichia coli]
MRIEAGLSTYEKELALMGEDIRTFSASRSGNLLSDKKPDSHVRCG